MKLWYVTLLTLLVFAWLSVGVAYTDMQGPWVWDKPVSPAVKAAMMRCGPNYHYRTLYDGTLQVNRGQGWERLRYRRV